MRSWQCPILLLGVAGLACAGRSAAGRAALAVEDEPLPAEASEPVAPGGAPQPRIRIDSASFGANCGQPEGNETANLAKRCDGRRRCTKRVMLKMITRTIRDGQTRSCEPEYLAKWTCGDDSPLLTLRSISSEAATSRLRLGCGPEQPPRTKEPSAPIAATATTGDTVRGRVVTPDGFPVARRRVSLGAASTLTDADGGFEFPGVPRLYDVHVADWHGRVPASVYLGLTRRDPVLVIREGAPPKVGWRYHASILDGVSSKIAAEEGPWAKRVVQFLSPRGWPEPRESGDGRYQSLEVAWRGGETLTGKLVSLVAYGPGEDPWASAYLATSPLSLLDGDAVAASPRLHKIGSGLISGQARTRGPLWPSPNPETLRFNYVVPGLMASIDLGECPANGHYACHLPDLSELGGEYCMQIGVESWDERVSRCGGRLGMDDFSVPARPPAPVLKYGDEVDGGTIVAWTGEGRVFELRLGSRDPANIHVYTAKQSFSWDQFVALGFGWSEFLRVGFGYGREREANPVLEVFTVSALYPYDSMDDLASGRGVMATGTSWEKVPTARDNFPSKRGHVSVPESVVSRLRAFKAPATVSAPLDLFHLPACSSTAGATPVADIRPAMVETRVSVRGTLTFAGWACTLKGCECCNACSSEWIVEDRRVPGSSILMARDGGRLGIGANECKIPPTPQIDVVATGRLMSSLGAIGPVRSRFFLDDVSLCAVKNPREPHENATSKGP